MRKRLIFVAMLAAVIGCHAQEVSLKESRGPVFGLKTNIPYWGTVTPNLGAELRLARHWTLDVEVGLNPFTNQKDDGSYGKQIKHFRLHPEARYWFCESFYGHFLGLHVPYLIYNVSDIKLFGTEGERHQGWGTGVGVSYGYDWVLGKHWNLEATVGVGYLYLESDKYPCASCGTKQETVKKHYFGPTQAAVNLIYLF